MATPTTNFIAVCANAKFHFHQLHLDNKHSSRTLAFPTLPPLPMRRSESKSALRLLSGSATQSPTTSRRTRGHRFLCLRSSSTSAASTLFRPRNLALILRRPTCIALQKWSRSSCPTCLPPPPLQARQLSRTAASTSSIHLVLPARLPSFRSLNLLPHLLPRPFRRLARSASL